MLPGDQKNESPPGSAARKRVSALNKESFPMSLVYPKDPACSTLETIVSPAHENHVSSHHLSCDFTSLPPSLVSLCQIGGLKAHEPCFCKLMFPRANEHLSGNQSLQACLLPLVLQLSPGSLGKMPRLIATESMGVM